MDIDLRAYRKTAAYAYAIGVYPTLELLTSRLEQVRKVLVSPRGESNEGVSKIVRLCEARGIPVDVSEGRIRGVAGNENTYAVGIFEKYEGTLSDSENHLVLVHPEDAGNAGTIIRTMLGFDITNLAVIHPAVDLFAPKTVRASMGAVFQTNFAYYDSFEAYRSLFSHATYPFMTDGQQTLEQVDFRAPYSLVFGNEGAGLGPEFATPNSVRIPQSTRIDSLNLAVSVGIALYVATRSRPEN